MSHSPLRRWLVIACLFTLPASTHAKTPYDELLDCIQCGCCSQPPVPSAGEGKSDPTQRDSNSNQEPGNKDNRGTESVPLVVKIQSPPSAESNSKNIKSKNEEHPTDWWMVWVTFLLVLVGIAQVWLFYVQLRIIRESLADAKIAADAAKEGAEAAQKSAEATSSIAHVIDRNGKQQIRAYLTVLAGADVPQDRSTGWKYEIRMIVRNTGFTPAHAINLVIRCALMTSELPDDFDFSLENTKDEGRSTLASGQQHILRTWLSDFITDEEIMEMKAGANLYMYVWGNVWYRDVFGDPHDTNFCHVCTWDVKNVFGTYNFHRHNHST